MLDLAFVDHIPSNPHADKTTVWRDRRLFNMGRVSAGGIATPAAQSGRESYPILSEKGNCSWCNLPVPNTCVHAEARCLYAY